MTGTLETVEVETTDCDAGSVVLNTAAIVFDDNGKWSGEYFTDYPVTLSAKAEEGHHFAGWEIDRGEGIERVDEAWLELDIPPNGIFVKAIFEED